VWSPGRPKGASFDLPPGILLPLLKIHPTHGAKMHTIAAGTASLMFVTKNLPTECEPPFAVYLIACLTAHSRACSEGVSGQGIVRRKRAKETRDREPVLPRRRVSEKGTVLGGWREKRRIEKREAREREEKERIWEKRMKRREREKCVCVREKEYAGPWKQDRPSACVIVDGS